jgi:DNA-binding NarL/FixJ family response regulator
MTERLRGRVRVLVADDEAGVREALAALVCDDAGLVLVGAVGDAPSTIELAEAAQPDVAVLDLIMPGGRRRAGAQQLRTVSPATLIIGHSD